MSKKGKKTKFIEEEKIAPKGKMILQVDNLIDKSDMDKSQFLCFLPEDSIYKFSRSKLLDTNLKLIVYKILADLNYLLYLNFKQFWATIKFNSTIRKCLESCLTYLNRPKYSSYVFAQQQQNITLNLKDSQTAQYLAHLYKILLMIYHRILFSEEENKQMSVKYECNKQIYNLWIFDIPKILNFIEIYAKGNFDITKIIVKKIFQIHSGYKQDFIDTLNTISQKILPQVMKNFKFIHDRNQFEEVITQDELRKKMKHLSTIKDLFNSLNNSFQFFPDQVSIIICSYNGILIPCQNIYYQLGQAYKNWHFNQYRSMVLPIIDDIGQDIVNFYLKVFTVIKDILLPSQQNSHVQYIKQIREAVIENFNQMLRQFGTVISSGKKNKDKKNLTLLQKLIDEFNFSQFLQQLQQSEFREKLSREGLQIFSKSIQTIQNLRAKKEQQEKSEQQNQEEQVPPIIEQKEIKNQDNKQQQKQIVNQIEQQQIVQKNIKEKSKIEQKQRIEEKSIIKKAKIQKEKIDRKTYERMYEDQYDDFIDYNRKIDKQSQESDIQLDNDDMFQKNPNRNMTKNSTNSKSIINEKPYQKKPYNQQRKQQKKPYIQQQSKRQIQVQTKKSYQQIPTKKIYKQKDDVRQNKVYVKETQSHNFTNHNYGNKNNQSSNNQPKKKQYKAKD